MVSNIQYRKNPRNAQRRSCQNESHAHIALPGLSRPNAHVSLRWRLPGCIYHCVGLRQKFVDLDISLDGRIRTGRGHGAAFECRSSTPNEALLAATAEYAAVLVVFVANASVSVRGS